MDNALGRLAGGSGAAWLVSGEPGIGKSRLLFEAGRRAAAIGAWLFEGQAAELERDFPFSVFVDALDPYLASLDSSSLRTLSEKQRRLLALVFPALDRGERETGMVAQERFRCYRAVGELLAMLAAQRPLVLVLDDLQWADAASLELLEHLLRRPPSAPVLLLLAHRTGFSPGALSQVSDRLQLTPLSREDADALLGDGLRTEILAQVYRESGGNPFYLEHLAWAERRRTPASGVRLQGELLDIEVPVPVREALAGEMAALGEQTRRVLQGAAVAGEQFTPELAGAIAEEDPPRVLAALDRAIAVGLVAGTETPVLFRFRHPIVRRAVYVSAGQAWRVGAHARAAGLLARGGAGPLARAHHIEHSAIRGDEDAVVDLIAAGELAAAVAPASAARWFAAALRLLPEEADDGRRLGVLVPLGAALGSAGRLEESRSTLVEILGALPAEAGAVRVRLIGFMALIDRLLGRHADARELLQRALRMAGERDAVEAAALELELAADRFFAGDWTAMHEHAERGFRIAAGEGGEGLRASAASLLGLAEYSVGRVRAARKHRAEALGLLDAPGSDARGLRLDALDWLGWLELSVEEYDAAYQHFTRGLEIGRRSGAGHLLSTMSFGLLLTCTWRGRLAEAIEQSDATLALGQLSGSRQVLSWAHGLRTLVDLRSGALARALDHGEQAQRLGDGLDANPFSAVNGGWFGEALIEAGQPVRGREQILRALGGDELPAVEAAYRPYFYDVLAGAEATLGRCQEATSWAGAAEATAEGLGLPGRDGAALHAAGVAEQDPTAGAQLALRAATKLALAHPIEAARARTLAGRHLGAAGNREAALNELRRASAELTALGAGHYAAQAVRERRHLGERLARGGRRASASTGIASLSDREREVAMLVQDRFTNRQIAARLVLSEKTVERHLSRIFVKLDARSRVDVARVLDSETSAA
ncbi:MAG: AAA family ATPase [Actinomycetota bacterium]|nr:AAA family ATPase [Actinomycetota bacterium]